MQFDNKQFESNVHTTMSTLDKLKKSLNLDGAAKGLDAVNASAKNCDMSGMSKGIETVRAKFSALQVMGVTALANITNSAVNAGKRIVSALTIEPIKMGFQEYETQINAVQTILANTQSKGTTLQQVNSALDTLNKYADKTIYNFTEMTRNIGTFTAAGVDLDTSVGAIQGIANLAAVSGSNAQQASTAMYQLSQALAAGKVQLMDWNSVVNAGMGGQVFQDALKKTSEQLNTGAEAAIKAKGSFRESLREGWLTSEVLTETLKKFTTSGANEYIAEYTGLSVDAVSAALEHAKAQYGEADAIDKASEALAKKSGKNKDEIKSTLELAKTAEDAATKVKTFSQLKDTLNEALQSGWTQSWEIMIGDFEEAKGLLTEISDKIGGMINESAEARNKMLSGGLSSGWKQLLNEGIADEEGYKETLKSVAKEHGTSIDKMIAAEKKLDDSLTDSEAFQKALKTGFKEGSLNSDMLTESVHKMADKMSKMSAEELKAAGYTSDHVKQIKELSKGLKDGTVSMDEFVKKMSRTSGRENVIQALWNAFDGLMSVIKPIKEAFREIFPAITGEQLYSFTESLIKFTEKLKLSSETADKVKRIFKGVFSIFDLGKKAITALFKPLFNLSQSKGISSLADLLLDIAAAVGDFFTSINEGAEAGEFFSTISDLISKGLSKVSDMFVSATDGVRSFGDVSSKIGDWFSKAWSVISDVAGKIKDAIVNTFTWISEHVSMGDIFAGLAGGGIFMALKKFGGLLDKIKDTIDNIFSKKDKGEGIGEKFKGILDQVHGALISFTSGIKISSLVAIAVAIGILSASLSTLSKLEFKDIVEGLIGVGALIGMLSGSFRSLVKSLSKFKSEGIIKAGIAMIAMSIAIKILSSALTKISELSLGDIAKGLLGLGVGLLELVGVLKLVEKSLKKDVSIKTILSFIVLAETCKILADALSGFATMSWSEVARGLVGMGGVLLELGAVMAILDKVGGGKSLVGAISIVIISLTLNKIANALQNFGSMSWDEVARGLVGMGGALLELGAVIAILDKVGGGKSLVGAISILLVVTVLDNIYDAFSSFALMSWDEIWRGLVGMGGALVELGVVTGLLGKLAGGSSLLGAATILLVAQALKPIGDTLSQIGKLSWDEIWRGLVGMGGALVELGVVTGLLGTFSPGAILGAVTILLVAQALKPIGDALSQIGQLTWEEIGRGLVGMGGALTELAVITGLLGKLGGLGAVLGGGAILIAVQGLGDLADALKKFGEMSWDEIGRGLTAMGAAMGEAALGSLLNTFSGFGASNISDVATALGTLADSLKKWTGVTVPENLGKQLGSLANAVMKFTLGGSGANAITEVAAPLGIMADSVKKWSGVVVPENLGTQMGLLADGVKKFTFGEMGAGALAEAAGPLGTLADSVKKWSGVVVPENLETQLSSLASGVKSFSFAFAGGWSMDAVIGPLGGLADSIKKWSEVTVPENLGTQLSSLASGVKSFSFAFAGGWSMDAVIGPLGNLADSIKKWTDVSIPENFGTNLKSVSDGIKEFGLMDAAKISAIDGPLNTLSTAFKNFSGITSTGSNLVTFATNIKSCSTQLSGINSKNITSASDSINKIVSIIKKVNDTSVGNVSAFVNAANSLNNINIDKINVDTGNLSAAISAIKKTMNSISKTISSSKSSIDSAMKTAVSSIDKVITSRKSDITSAGKGLASALEKAITSKKSSITSSCKNLVSEAAKGIESKRSTFKSAGEYLGSGLVKGIQSKYDDAYRAGLELGKRAAQGELDGQESASPSKLTIQGGKWLGEGLVIGIGKMGRAVYKAGYGMGETATDSISKAISTIANVSDMDIDSQPTIRPVLDLSDVESRAGDISNMLNNGSTIKLAANASNISAMMNRRNQNGINDEVVSAIDKLRKDIGKVKGPSYNIGGVSYEQGSDVSNAVEALVRAIKVEGRA